MKIAFDRSSIESLRRRMFIQCTCTLKSMNAIWGKYFRDKHSIMFVNQRLVVHEMWNQEKKAIKAWRALRREKTLCKLAGCTSQCSTPLGGMRCSLNIPGHPIINSKNVIMLPSNGREKPQPPMNIFLLIFKIQLYFDHSFSRNKSPEKCLVQT